MTTVLLPGDRTFSQSVNRASVQNDFYTALGHDGQETDAGERGLNEIEGPASDVWRIVADDAWPLTPEERGVVASWIALHLLRGTRSRATMSAIGTDLLQLEIIAGGTARLRDVLKDIGEPYDDESVSREWIFLFQDPLVVRANANHHLAHIVEMLPRVAESLIDRWWVLTSFERKGMATCDQPAFVAPNERDRAQGLGTGIQTADQVHLPMTRHLSLGLARRETLPAGLENVTVDVRQAGVTAVALYSNSCTVSSARRAIFHHPDDAPLKGLELPEPRLREVGGDGDPWRFMPDADRQLLVGAGLTPPASSPAD